MRAGGLDAQGEGDHRKVVRPQFFGRVDQRDQPRLDEALAQFAGRSLAEAFPYLILDARYERVREAGVISNRSMPIAIGIDWDGRRQMLAVELANRESRSSWRDFLLALKGRGLNGVEFVVAGPRA